MATRDNGTPGAENETDKTSNTQNLTIIGNSTSAPEKATHVRDKTSNTQNVTIIGNSTSAPEKATHVRDKTSNTQNVTIIGNSTSAPEKATHVRDKTSNTQNFTIIGNSTSAPEKATHVRDKTTPIVIETLAHVTEVEELIKTLTSVTICHSLLHRHLTKTVFEKIKGRKTSFGGTLADCIRSGCLNLDSQIGVYACDPEAYKVFSDVLDPVIKDYHNLPQKKSIHHPSTYFGDPEKYKFENLDSEGKFIISSSVRVGRSVDGFGYPPVLTTEAREELEKKVVDVLNDLTGDLKGTYHPLIGMNSETQERLTQGHFLFKDSDRFLMAAGGYEDWPTGRGIFYNEGNTFLVWVNEEDHLRLISMQPGGDIGVVYRRLVTAVKAIEEKLKFVRDDRLGFLTFCPSSLGTALRASVHMKIPFLAASEKFQSVCDKLNLQARGILGEHSDKDGDVYDISNKRRLGLTELQAIQEMYTGVKEIMRLEMELSWWPESVEDMFEHVSKDKHCRSLLKKHLTAEVFEQLKEKRTSHNASLGDCIISGAVNLDSNIGMYAADPESYTTFAPLFDPVIKDYHKLKVTDAIAHPASDFGDLDNLGFGDVDPEKEMIISTRIRVGRSHRGCAFYPGIKREDLVEMEQKTVAALAALGGELRGTYYPLEGMAREVQEKLTSDHFLFKDNDRFLKVAGGYKDWPAGRGIFFNEDKTLLVWVNEEDHVRIISMQDGGDVATVYRRLVTVIKAMEERLTFARDDRIGYLTFCPSNLGTALRASVHIKIPHLSARKDFNSTCEKLKLQARGIHGEHTVSEGAVYDISNKRRLGLTEIDAVRELVAGVQEIIRLEKEASAAKAKSCNVF